MNWFLLSIPDIVLKDYLTIWKVMKARWLQKSQFLTSLMNWENIGSTHSSRATFKIQSFEYMGKLGKFMANLRFTVENKMRNSHKKGWSHFKLNINDWDIPFPKTLRIYQWFWKNILQWEKWNEFNRNSPHITECLANMSWRYIFP